MGHCSIRHFINASKLFYCKNGMHMSVHNNNESIQNCLQSGQDFKQRRWCELDYQMGKANEILLALAPISMSDKGVTLLRTD